MKSIINFFDKVKSVIGRPETKSVSVSPQFGARLVTMMQANSHEAEQFKMLTANIENYRFRDMANGNKTICTPPPRVIMVTSTRPGEGKSFVAANLAMSIAKNTNKHVLLIDADLRSPTIHKYFGYTNARGLSEYLSKKDSLAKLFIKPGVGNLTVLTAGIARENSYRLLSSARMTGLIKGLQAKCPDLYVIIDTAPPKLVAESKVIAELADGIALTVNHNRTNQAEISDLLNTLGRKKIVGFIMNRYEHPLKAYGYGNETYYAAQCA